MSLNTVLAQKANTPIDLIKRVETNILNLKAEELTKVSDSIFVRRNTHRLIQFKPKFENETFNMLSVYRDDSTIVSTCVKVDNDKKDPVEFLLEGDFEKTLKAYRTLIEQDSTHPTVTEDYLNDLGNRFSNEDRMELSKNTFKLNMMLYSDSFKVYESYAKASMKTGENDLAILYCSISLELNSENNEVKDMLKELQSDTSLNSALAEEDGIINPDFPPLENRYLSQKPPRLVPEIFAPGIVSTEAYLETVVTFLPDMKELSLTRSGGKYKKPTLFVMQNQNNRWNRKSILPTDINKYKERFNPGLSEIKSYEPFKDIPIVGFSVSAKGTYYFYVLDFADGGSGHMSYSRFIDGKYEAPRKLSKAINTGKYIAHPFIAPDESYLIWDAEKDGKILLISILVFDKKMVHGEQQLIWEIK